MFEKRRSSTWNQEWRNLLSTQEIISTKNLQGFPLNREADQYTFRQILGIWTLAALPMALLVWMAIPAFIPYSSLHPSIVDWLLIIAGGVRGRQFAVRRAEPGTFVRGHDNPQVRAGSGSSVYPADSRHTISHFAGSRIR